MLRVWSGWQLASLNMGAGRLWSIEGVATAHIVLAGLLLLHRSGTDEHSKIVWLNQEPLMR